MLVIIYKCFNKREACALNYDHSHCRASCDLKTEKQKCYHIDHTSCGHCGSNELVTDALRYHSHIVITGKVWSI